MKTKKNESMLPGISELGDGAELKMDDLEKISGGRRGLTDKEFNDYQSTLLILNNKLIATKGDEEKKKLKSHYEDLVNKWHKIINSSYDYNEEILFSDFLKSNNVEL